MAEAIANSAAVAVPVPKIGHDADDNCRNCGTFLGNPRGKFCPSCGQDTLNHPPTFFEFVHEFITHYVALEGKLWKTLWLLFFKPAELTREYREGRKQRYISPLRLYITASFLFFLLVKIAGFGSLFKVDDADTTATPTPLVPALVHIKVGETPSAQAPTNAKEATPAATATSATVETVKETSKGDTVSSKDAEKLNEAVKLAVEELVGEATETAKVAAEESAAQRKAATRRESKFTAANFGCQTESALCKRIENHINSKYKDKTETQMLTVLKDGALNNIPYAMFLLLPLFALLTKLLYVGRGYYYGEHVVYALHIHAFTFFAMLMIALVPAWLAIWLPPVVALYYFIALKRYFGGGWFTTFLRYGVIAILYPVMLTLVATFVLLLVIVA
jgi:Protein of unknown function (DUF3667)